MDNNINMEKWVRIKEFPNYVIDCRGNVRNYNTGTIIKHNISNKNCRYVRLRNNGKEYNRSVNALIAMYFRDRFHRYPDDNSYYCTPVIIEETGIFFNNEEECAIYLDIPTRYIVYSLTSGEGVGKYNWHIKTA